MQSMNMHSAKRKSVFFEQVVLGGLETMLTFVSGDKGLDVFRNVLVEMQFANVEGLDHRALIEH